MPRAQTAVRSFSNVKVAAPGIARGTSCRAFKAIDAIESSEEVPNSKKATATVCGYVNICVTLHASLFSDYYETFFVLPCLTNGDEIATQTFTKGEQNEKSHCYKFSGSRTGRSFGQSSLVL